ncbi:uncharacterized protein LOC125225569 [Leguminivora glycinivorella]|uniref:uncharacterized protein LOC125225569 n=1 Tax=Leguminivora glycinivorella TaxID=1035111 RepID=UPI00200F2F41|nr:uncharacterized protein LOC125225569 [Leguminivora glycinivorella]
MDEDFEESRSRSRSRQHSRSGRRSRRKSRTRRHYSKSRKSININLDTRLNKLERLMKKIISSSSQGSTTVENKSKRQNNITSAISVTVDPTNDGAFLSTTPPIARSIPELGSDGAVLSAGGLTSSGACGERAIPRSPLLPVPAATASARCAARQPVAASCSRASCNSFSVCTQDPGNPWAYYHQDGRL